MRAIRALNDNRMVMVAYGEVKVGSFLRPAPRKMWADGQSSKTGPPRGRNAVLMRGRRVLRRAGGWRQAHR